MLAKNDTVELSFMLVGHTKFSPDRFFGLIKKLYRVSSVSTLPELVSIIERSTVNGQNVAQLVNPLRGNKVVFRQWSSYLSRFFKTIPNISTYHGFKMKSSAPGVVFVPEFSDSKEKKENILRTDADISLLASSEPNPTQIPGLDAKRQWYLYEQIRPHCSSVLAADLTCPKPTVLKPGSNQDTEGTASTQELNESTPKRPRKCSKCKTTGHNKRNCPN